MKYKLGILGGMGPFATADTLARLVKFTSAKTDQEHVPTVIVSDPRIPDRSDFICGLGADPVPKLLEGLRTLENAGVEAVIIPCNTAHFFVPRLKEAAQVPILDMPDETVAYIAGCLQKRRVMVLGTEGLLNGKCYQDRFAKFGFVIEEISRADRQVVMSVIREIKGTGDYQQSRSSFEDVLARANRQKDCCFVFACTELSLIRQHYSGLQVVDPLDVLVITAIRKLGYPIHRQALLEDDARYRGKLAEHFGVAG
jgi:aspartate racemase